MKKAPATKRQLGMTLVELLLVIGIGSLIVVGGIALFGSASDKNKGTRLVRDFGVLTATASSMYANSPNYAGISNTVLINSRGLPTSMVSGTNIVHPWGTISVAPASGNTQYTVTYSSGIPSEICVSFVTSTINSVDGIKVDGTVVPPNNAVSIATSKCGSSTAGPIIVTNQ
ncbi:type 4 pilus major pilin (plasmid) [Methylomarinum sp. Ch1-1]|uniref:Type 4 pilus major pilin n=1 Tax=Methylomarinum roseum TaxID=3067653 RepID=A0AAU7P0R5_9GAMM|nr:type 4 pilus major pilin [Methylomarinum sp. Ch1-1]MDP4523212.1 type 4 pilus major pilin [Methylomarinum sp. Ch1-1]